VAAAGPVEREVFFDPAIVFLREADVNLNSNTVQSLKKQSVLFLLYGTLPILTAVIREFGLSPNLKNEHTPASRSAKTVGNDR
jgi:hypothetical protein